MEQQKLPETGAQPAHLGRSLTIRGEISGSEDLYLDSQVEGAIVLKGNQLTIGPNGRIKADISASSAVIHGKLEGNIDATERVDLKQSAIVSGDIVTQRISIDDGAFFKGGVDISRGSVTQGTTQPKPGAQSGAPGGTQLRATPPDSPRSIPAASSEPRK